MSNKQFSLITDNYRTVGQLSLAEVVTAVQSGAIGGINFKQNILTLQDTETPKEMRDKIKSQLPAFTPAGIFKDRRKTENLDQYSQIIGLDFDKIKDLDSLKEKVNNDPHTILSFVSPSGNGLKVFVQTDALNNEHTKAFKQVWEYYNNLTGIESDPSVKDLARMCYFSYDEEIYFNKKTEDDQKDI